MTIAADGKKEALILLNSIGTHQLLSVMSIDDAPACSRDGSKLISIWKRFLSSIYLVLSIRINLYMSWEAAYEIKK